MTTAKLYQQYLDAKTESNAAAYREADLKDSLLRRFRGDTIRLGGGFRLRRKTVSIPEKTIVRKAHTRTSLVRED